MSNETLMTSDAEQPNASEAASEQTAQPGATAAPDAGQQQQSTEAPVAEGQPEKAPAEEAKPEGAPENYEFTNTDAMDPEVLGQYAEVAKELGLSQDAAQTILDKVMPTIQSRQQEQMQAISQQWADQARTDKEFGGDKLDGNLALAKRALDAYATPELRNLLNDSGLGNHPEVIRFMVRAGQSISEDSFVAGGRNTNEQASAKRLYPNSNMN